MKFGNEKIGQKTPNFQGWYSRNGRELVQNFAIGYPLNGKSFLYTTVFDFKMEKTGKPYLRMGSEGRYLRFALTQENEKTDVKIRIGKDNARTIEVEIDGSQVEVEIEYDEG